MSLLTAIRKNDGLKVLVIVLSLFILGTGIVITARQSAPVAQPEQNVQIAQPQSTALSAILYGSWEGNETVVHAVNADGTGDQVVARIPLAVKNIHRLSDSELLYIANTNQNDHGDSIVIKNVTTGTVQTVVSASSGFGIDSLIVSANGSWISYWEVQLGPTGQLANGHSRVYTAQLGTLPAERNLVFDESAAVGAVVHYPLFFDHNGNLYADGFSPNQDGWGQGLVQTAARPTSANPDSIGANQFVEVLADANYNSDPVLSPTANTIVYSAYQPTAGTPMNAIGTSGKLTTESVNPNTIMLLDLDTQTTRPLTSQQNRLYYDLTWKDDGTQLFARSYGSDGTQLTDAQAITIDLNSGVTSQWDTTKIVDGIILDFGPDGLITGIGHASGSTGNLGATYAPVLAGIAVGDGTNLTTIPTSNAQFITTIPGTVPLGAVNAGYRTGNNSLQLATFTQKPELEQRPAQQNNILSFDPTIKQGSWCRKIYYQLIGKASLQTSGAFPEGFDPASAELDTTVGRDPSLQLGQFGPKMQTQNVGIPFNLADFRAAKPILLNLYKCSTSPLYLYPERPTRVQVKVPNNEIIGTNVPYSKEFGWNVMADPAGTKIDYDYTAYVTIPPYGLVVPASDLSSTLADYGAKVGLVGRELTDYVTLWKEELPPADYYLVTHFPDPSSIMKFEITPEPDVMMQTVMYFRGLTATDAAGYVDLPAPTFAPVPHRHGFTAVDWSGIIDR